MPRTDEVEQLAFAVKFIVCASVGYIGARCVGAAGICVVAVRAGAVRTGGICVVCVGVGGAIEAQPGIAIFEIDAVVDAGIGVLKFAGREILSCRTAGARHRGGGVGGENLGVALGASLVAGESRRVRGCCGRG